MFEEFWKMMQPINYSEEKKLSEQEQIIETIKSLVLDWIEKYHPREWDSNLKVNNPDNIDELIRWKNWVLWRIKHQIIWSGFWNLSDYKLFKIISIALHEYFQDDPWYHQYLLKILPTLEIEI